MGHYEDLFWEITESVNRMGIRKEFEAQLEKMRYQDKHKYREVRDKWDYAFNKVKNAYNKKQKENGEDEWDNWHPSEEIK